MIDYTEFCEVLQVDPSPQCEGVFQVWYLKMNIWSEVRSIPVFVSNFALRFFLGYVRPPLQTSSQGGVQLLRSGFIVSLV